MANSRSVVMRQCLLSPRASGCRRKGEDCASRNGCKSRADGIVRMEEGGHLTSASNPSGVRATWLGWCFPEESPDRRLILFPLALFLVLSSGLLHAIWNLFVKRSLNKIVFLWSFQWVAVVVFLPWALAAIGHHHVPVRGWALFAVTAALHGAYVLLLAKTYSIGDLSQVYPLMRGVGPFLVPILGVVLLGEHLSRIGWLGVGAVVIGIGMLGGWRRPEPRSRRTQLAPKATWLALAVGLSITAYTMLDKITLHYIPAASLNDGSNLGNMVALSWWAIRSRAIKSEWTANWKAIVAGGIVSPGGYLLFLKALYMAPVARLAPMREIGTVFATILGIVVLKETQGRRRMVAAGLITAGVILLATYG